MGGLDPRYIVFNSVVFSHSPQVPRVILRMKNSPKSNSSFLQYVGWKTSFSARNEHDSRKWMGWTTTWMSQEVSGWVDIPHWKYGYNPLTDFLGHLSSFLFGALVQADFQGEWAVSFGKLPVSGSFLVAMLPPSVAPQGARKKKDRGTGWRLAQGGTWMSRWKLGLMVGKWVISPT